MVIDTLTTKVLERIKKQGELEEKTSIYWAKCKKCGRTVVKNHLVKDGCFVCGWKPE